VKSTEPSAYAVEMQKLHGDLEEAAKAGAIPMDNRMHGKNLKKHYYGYKTFSVFGSLAYDVLQWAHATGFQYAWYRRGDQYIIVTTAEWPETDWKPKPKYKR
jgi:hypothetical protein